MCDYEKKKQLSVKKKNHHSGEKTLWKSVKPGKIIMSLTEKYVFFAKRLA